MNPVELVEAWPPALAAAVVVYLARILALILAVAATWLRNWFRLLPELTSPSDWLKATGLFLLLGIPVSAGVAAGVALLQLLGWLGGERLMLGVSLGVTFLVLAILVAVKWHRAA